MNFLDSELNEGTPARDLKLKSFILDIDKVNNEIRKKGFKKSYIIKLKESNYVIASVNGDNIKLNDLISLIYKINCVRCEYTNNTKVKISYFEN